MNDRLDMNSKRELWSFQIFESNVNQSHFSELAAISQKSEKVRLALQELATAYEYAGMSANHALETAKQLREMCSPERGDPDQNLNDLSSYQEYTQKVEYHLNELASQLATTAGHTGSQEFIYRAFLMTKAILKSLLHKEE